MEQLAFFMNPSRLSWKIISWLSYQIFNANRLIFTGYGISRLVCSRRSLHGNVHQSVACQQTGYGFLMRSILVSSSVQKALMILSIVVLLAILIQGMCGHRSYSWCMDKSIQWQILQKKTCNECPRLINLLSCWTQRNWWVSFTAKNNHEKATWTWKKGGWHQSIKTFKGVKADF